MRELATSRLRPLVADRFLEAPRAALPVTAVAFAAALAGSLAHPDEHLTAFWPVNALLLGLMVRNPKLSSIWSWSSAALAYVCAGVTTGREILVSTWLALANLAGLGLAFLLFRQLGEDDQHLGRPLAVLHLLIICAAASAFSGLIGHGGALAFLHRDLLASLSYWIATEFAGFAIILPAIVTAPPPRDFRRQFRLGSLSFETCAPVLALAVSTALGLAMGGPGAILIPVPALLWCALSYSVFATAALTLVTCACLLMAMTPDMPNLAASHAASIVSARLGIALLSLGTLAAASINAARNELLRTLDRLASHDGLTDALTRRAFMKRGEALMSELVPEGFPVTVLMLDIDHFKAINDRHGHAAGDRALSEFAAAVRTVLRDSDLFGRLGGEEFAAVLPRIALDDAMAIAERIRRRVESADILLQAGEPLKVSVSIGVASLSGTAPGSLEPLLLRADAALYRAKSAGRNQVAVAWVA